MTKEKTPAANEFTTSARDRAMVTVLIHDGNLEMFCAVPQVAQRLDHIEVDSPGASRAIIAASRKARCFKTPSVSGATSPTVRFCHVRTFPARFNGALLVTGGIGLPVRAPARLTACFENPAHPSCFKTWRVASSLSKEPETMSMVMTGASTSAAPANPLNELEISQLYAQAENALSLALFHLRQPSANVPGAARKAVQALSALNALRVVEVAA